MSLRSHIKRNARHALRGNWGVGAAGTLLLLAVYLAFAYAQQLALSLPEMLLAFRPLPERTAVAFGIQIGMLFLLYLLFYPLYLGFQRFCYLVAGDAGASAETLFYYFTERAHYRKAAALGLHIAIRRVGWMMLFLLPYALLDVVSASFGAAGKMGIYYAALEILIQALYYFGLIAGGVAGLRYFAAPYLLFEQPGMRAGSAVSASVRLMRGKKSEMFMLYISFLPWYLLSLSVVGLFLTLPLLETTKGIYGKYYFKRFLKDRDAFEEPMRQTREIETGKTDFTKPEGSVSI